MIADEAAVGIVSIAELLDVSVDTAYRKAKLGEIPGFKVGNRWRFFPSQVREFVSKPADPWAYSPQSRAARRRAS